MKPPSRHINATQRAGMGVVGLALVSVGVQVAGHPLEPITGDVVMAAIYGLAAIATGMGSMSAGRDVAKAWKGSPSVKVDESPVIDERPA